MKSRVTPPQFHDVEQGSLEWFKLRLGLPTASMFHAVLSSSHDKLIRTDYMRKLAGEIVTGKPMETYSNRAMERGKEIEPEARRHYAFTHDVELTQIGFITNGIAGCSPDALVGDDGILELKNNSPHILIELLDIPPDRFPAKHKAQCQGSLWVTGRKWVDLVSYCQGMKTFERRAPRDEVYIARLAEDVELFAYETRKMAERIK